MEDTTQLVLPNQQFWVFLIGALVPLAGYFINMIAPWNNETFKGVVQVVLTSIGGVLYTVIFGDVKGAGDFFQQTVTAVISGLFTHEILWKPSGINLLLGANPPALQEKPQPLAERLGRVPQ